MIFPANDGSSKVVQPTDGPFDDPTAFVAAELSPVLQWRADPRLSVWADQVDSVSLEPPSQAIAVGRFVVDQSLGLSLPQNSIVNQRFNQNRFVSIGRLGLNREWKPLGIHHEHDFRAFAATCRSNLFAPFFADENVPSANVSEKSICSFSSSFMTSRKNACSSSPASVQVLSRKWQVDFEGKVFGKSFQRAPVRNTQRIPSRQSRGCTWGRPPSLAGGSHGNRSAINSHCLSVNSHSESILDPKSSTASWWHWDRVGMSTSFRRNITSNTRANSKHDIRF